MNRQAGFQIWWLNPASLFCIAGVGVGVAALAVPESTYRNYWRTPKFFDARALEITLLCVMVFLFGTIIGRKLSASHSYSAGDNWRSQIPWNSISSLFRLSFWLCVLGYAIWAGLAIQRGVTFDVVAGILSGENGAMYEARYVYFPTVGGVTTLTQFGTAAMILGTLLAQFSGWASVRFRLAVVFSFALARALLNSERFALIELAIPMFVVWISVQFLGRKDISKPIRRLVPFAPIVGVATLLCLFTTFEYFRSWTNYYAGRDLGLWEFGAMRLLGYYVTSFNNGGYLLERLDTLGAPYFCLHFLWGFPLTGPLVKRLFPSPLLDTDDKWFYFPFLESGANVEFNNADGMLFPLMDFGIAGGLLYWLFLGAICGAAYQLFTRRHLAGLLLYPMVFLGLLEIPLALYWAEGRAFPSLVLLLVAASRLFNRQQHSQASFIPQPKVLTCLSQ